MKVKTMRGIGIIYFGPIIALKLMRIFNEALMSISNKYNYKAFTKSRRASLLDYIKNIFNHSNTSGKCRDSLEMVALSFTKSTGLCTISAH